MGIKSERVFSRLGLFLSIVALSALGPTGVHSTAEQVSASHEYVLKVSDVTRVGQLVESLGGSVNHEMPTLGYLGVELSKEQVKLISRSVLVTRISEGSVKLAGYWWDYKAAPDIPGVEDVDRASLAGYWWDYKALPEMPGSEDVDSNSVAGYWWDYKALPEIPGSEDVDSNSVAGYWWDYKAVPEAPEAAADDIEYGGIAELEAGGEFTVAGYWWQY